VSDGGAPGLRSRGASASAATRGCVGHGASVSAAEGLCQTAALELAAGLLCRLLSAAGLLCRTAGRRAHKDGNKNPSANLVDCVSKLACLCRPRGFCVGLRGAVSDGGA